jgi:hypothetical protein
VQELMRLSPNDPATKVRIGPLQRIQTVEARLGPTHPANQKSLIDVWREDIERHRDSIVILRGILKERGDE